MKLTSSARDRPAYLFVAQGLDRIQASGFIGRIESKK
jgi:CRISPR/Cas system-associated endoribonuclease Cas2